MDLPTEAEYRLLSIDAWRDGPSWTWNNWFHVANVPRAYASLPARALLKALRTDGYLRAASAGKCAVEDDQYNVVIVDRRNGCPIYAIEYGASD